MTVLAHRTVAAICVNLANEIYEELAPRNDFYKRFPDRAAFLKLCAPTLVHEARSIMAKMLNDPEISDFDKAQIFEAICQDMALPDSENRSTITVN